MKIQEIAYDSPAWHEAWQIREDVLRKPLGLSLNDEDLSDEAKCIHLAALDHEENVIGCMIMQKINVFTIKMRQLAVSEEKQRKNIGTKLVKHAEQLATQLGYTKIFLYARINVREFYEKLGYKAVGEEHMLIGIPHITMEKPL